MIAFAPAGAGAANEAMPSRSFRVRRNWTGCQRHLPRPSRRYMARPLRPRPTSLPAHHSLPTEKTSFFLTRHICAF